MVGSLVLIHLYLATHNLTTWEWLSWKKISYLKVWPKKYGSPFGYRRTKLQNLYQFCCKGDLPEDTLIKWQMPKSLPDIEEIP